MASIPRSTDSMSLILLPLSLRGDRGRDLVMDRFDATPMAAHKRDGRVEFLHDDPNVIAHQAENHGAVTSVATAIISCLLSSGTSSHDTADSSRVL